MKLNRKQIRQMILNEIKLLTETENVKSKMEALVAEKPGERFLGSAKMKGNIGMARSTANMRAVTAMSRALGEESPKFKVIKQNHDGKEFYVVIEKK